MCKGPALRGSEALSQNSVAGTESGKNKAEVGRGQMFRARTRGKTLSLHSKNKGMPLKSFPGGQEAGWWMGVIGLAVGAVKGGVGGGSFGEPC